MALKIEKQDSLQLRTANHEYLLWGPGIVGQIGGPWKGHEDLLAAFSRVVAFSAPTIELHVFGKVNRLWRPAQH